jgi:hypothetical protein
MRSTFLVLKPDTLMVILAGWLRASLASRAMATLMCLWFALPASAQETWTCQYTANDPRSPVRVTSTFRVEGNELVEVDTIPKGLNFGERYAILENTNKHIVAAISIAKFGERPPPDAIGAVVVIIGKENSVYQQSGVLLAFRPGPPTMGRCAKGEPPESASGR